MQYRKISIKDWNLSGEGATAQSYYNNSDDSIMLKLFTGSVTSEEYALAEYNFSHKVEMCGISTPRALEVVECDGKIGIIYERIKDKKSISSLCADNPNQIPRYAKLFAGATKMLHGTSCCGKNFDSRQKQILDICENEKLYSKNTKAVFKKLLERFPDQETCLHGDLQTGNLIIADDKLYWIDLGSFAYGNPMYDIACLHFFTQSKIGLLWAKNSLHMNAKQLDYFWQCFKREYFKTSEELEMAKFEQDAKLAQLLYLAYTIALESYSLPVKAVFCLVINIMASKAKLV